MPEYEFKVEPPDGNGGAPVRQSIANKTVAWAGWFGESRRLAGWVHQPSSGAVRGGVVIFPSIGYDYYIVHSTFRTMATQLADAGFAVLRFDYDGTGESVGSGDDPDRVAAWLRSGEEAIELLRRCGAGWIAAAGMRLGASMAAVVAERVGGLDALVLWDPMAAQTYVAQQHALARLSYGARSRPDGAVEIPGLTLSGQTVEDLGPIDVVRTAGSLASRVLCLTRNDLPPDDGLIAHFASGNADWAEASGQDDLFDQPPPNQIVPAASMGAIVGWLSSAAPDESVVLSELPMSSATQFRQGDQLVAERVFVTGSAGLVGTVTEPLDGGRGPTAVFMNVSNECRVGPNGMWVKLARQWAESGLRSVRFDLSGLGDSEVRDGQTPGILRVGAHFDDVEEMVEAISPDDPSNVVLIGLCSSAYQAIESAFDLKPRGVCAVNPMVSFEVPEMEGPEPTIDPRRRIARHRSPFVASFSQGNALWPLMKRFPKLLWFARNALSPHRPSKWLSVLAKSGVIAFYIVGDYESRQMFQGSAATVKRLTAKNMVDLQVVADLDHGLMCEKSRQTVIERLSRHMLETFLSTPHAS